MPCDCYSYLIGECTDCDGGKPCYRQANPADPTGVSDDYE
jgi:hypothetical protein